MLSKSPNLNISLFPQGAEDLYVRQGATADCYLLAALICLWKNGKAYQDQLKSMFKQQEDGSIEVRIKRSAALPQKQINSMKGKYTYQHLNGEDIITISPRQLKKIIEQSQGILIGSVKSAESNSLGVLILEHLSSYYFKPKDSPEPNLLGPNSEGNFDSIVEHSREQERFDASFLGDLLGFKQVICRDIKKIQAYKELFPEEFIFYGTMYNQCHNGQQHVGHALVLESIKEISRGAYALTSINPWDSSKTEEFKPGTGTPVTFAFFVLDEAEHNFKMGLASQCIPEIASLIVKNEGI